MDEKEFILDVWDVLNGNTQYITQERFIQKYKELFLDMDSEQKTINLSDEHNEWRLLLQKVWSDGE